MAELPFAAGMGTAGSWVGLGLNVVCLVAQFYVALFPVNGGGRRAGAGAFFQSFLAAPLILGLYGFWKVYSACSGDERINHRGWKLFMRSHEMDLTSGMREGVLEVPEGEGDKVDDRTLGQKIARLPVTVWKALI